MHWGWIIRTAFSMRTGSSFLRCRAANLQPYDVFYDLGSGVGKLVLYLALLGNCSKAVGLEIGERRHADAMIALKRLIKRRLAVEEPLTTEVDFALRDISRERYHDVTVAFISNLLMERSITERTLKALLCCPPLRRVRFVNIRGSSLVSVYRRAIHGHEGRTSRLVDETSFIIMLAASMFLCKSENSPPMIIIHLSHS